LREQTDIEVIGEAQNGEEAVEKSKELMPDVILMDIYMPGMGGLEAARRIKATLPYVKIIMLTVSEEDKDLFEAIKAGAHGYLVKKIEPANFLRTLRGVFHGEAAISRTSAIKILDEFARLARNHSGTVPSHEQLSTRELEVLTLLTKGTTNKEIAAVLSISENTVKNHLQNILVKLHLENRVQAATYALRHGLT
jgi:DNA-binding NarL/FixJ family response regulator